jgi:hypothetical protein
VSSRDSLYMKWHLTSLFALRCLTRGASRAGLETKKKETRPSPVAGSRFHRADGADLVSLAPAAGRGALWCEPRWRGLQGPPVPATPPQPAPPPQSPVATSCHCGRQPSAVATSVSTALTALSASCQTNVPPSSPTCRWVGGTHALCVDPASCSCCRLHHFVGRSQQIIQKCQQRCISDAQTNCAK